MSATESALTLVVLAHEGDDTGRLLASIDRHGPPDLPVLVHSRPHDGRGADGVATLEAAEKVATPVFVVVPADTVFVRDFTAGDFIDPSGQPRLHLTEDAERRVAGTSDLTAADRRLIAERAGLDGIRILWPAGPLAMSVAEVRQVCEGWAELDAVPDVAAWYAAWKQAQTGPTLDWHEPVFLLLGSRGLPVDVSLRGVSQTDVSRGYLGYIGELPGEPDPVAAAMPPALLMSAAARGVYAKMPRVRRVIDRVTGRSD